jgi:acyl-CoA thioester hydrolase
MNSQNPMPATGIVKGETHLFPVRVYIEDTDLGCVVYYANYLKFLERARSDLLRALGINHRSAIESGLGAYAVVEVQIKYRKPARLDDDLVVISRLRQLRPVALAIEQKVMRGDELLTDSTVTVAFLGPDGRPKRQPEEWLGKFQQLVERKS